MKSFSTLTLLFTTLFLGGCFLKPHVVDVQQGNIINKQQMQRLHVGMTKTQVRSILGNSILNDSLNDNVWNYIHTNQIDGGLIKEKKLTLYFSNNRLSEIDSHGY
ncbi:MAG: outer membrane protein assembly factor BamE [Gammaproteobacteria bacterium]|nr:outer membrane protein assembly factor BamE [Gammaproteobacteria bacterium]